MSLHPEFESRVALVTGANSGIGRAIADRLEAAGATVVATDLARSTDQPHPRRIYYEHDVTDEHRWNDVIDDVRGRFGRLDMLVNNAGGGLSRPIDQLTVEKWDELFALNVTSVMVGTRSARALLAQSGKDTPQGSSIVNMSSVLGVTALPGVSAYAASKGAVRLFTKACALEFAEADLPIRVNSVHPGFVDTPLLRRGLKRQAAAASTDEDVVASRISAAIPLKRLGRPADIAGAVAFLLSDDAGYMTGSELLIDGGWTSR